MGFNANVLKFDKNNNVEDFTFILSTKSYKHIGKLNNIKRDTIHFKNNLNSAKEISFEIYKEIDGQVERHWDKIVDLKSVYVKEVGEYFQIKVTYDDKLDEVKTITGTSLCEAELSQTNIHETEINTDADIARDDYVITTFYNEDNPKASLLHRVLSKVPHYTIRYVDDSLKKLQRSFSINGTSVYDFLTGECAEQFNCLFVFYSMDRSIAVYDLYTVCNECGYRGYYNDICPECGSNFLNYFGEDTSIFVNKENLTENVQLDIDVDSIKNCFRLSAGDDMMTATIVDLNQNGTPYMYYISEEQKADMSAELVKKINDYDEEYASYSEEYQQLLQDIWDVTDDILYYESGMMPGDSSDSEDSENAGNDQNNTESMAEQEAAKLTIENLSPLGLTSVTESTSVSTVNSALESYARVFVKTGYVKVKVSESKFTYSGKNSEGFGYGKWVGKFKVTNYSDEEDVAYSSALIIDVHENNEEFIKQKVMKDIAINEDEYSVFDVLEIDNLDLFQDALTKYCMSRLDSFKDAINTALECLMAEGQGTEDAELYESIYVPYYEKLKLCEAEIDVRKAQIDELKVKESTLNARKSEIHKALNFENYLGEELYNEFCAYRRESEYSNTNYVSDGMNNTQIIEHARDFLETAKKELIKSATRQKSISTNLYNLLAMEEFKPLVEKFALGNFIRVQAGNDIYRLRLVSYEINFSDLNTIAVEFSDMTQTADGMNDVTNILKSAQSMSSSYSYVSKQAEKGEIANTAFEDMYKEGINSALYQIKNNVNEEVIIDKGGILGRAWDDILNDYSPEQVRITHNILAFTNDGWRSVETALGKHGYYKFVNGKLVRSLAYGLTANFITAGYINGSQIIGGEIYSHNYTSTSGTYMDLNNGDFSLAGGNIKYDSETNDLTLKGVTIEWTTTNSPEITDISGLKEYLMQLDGRIQTYSQDTDPSVNWTDEEKSVHIGDLWFDTENNLTKRWNGSSWDTITDSELKELAQSKAQIFTATPTVPYYVGDLWVQGSDGDILNCIVTRTSGSYTASDWEKSSKYTDDSALQNFISGEYSDDLKNISTQIDGKARAWYQDTDPSLTWDKNEDHEGDLWYDTDADSQVTFIYNNGAWRATSVPKEIFDTIDGIASIYVTLPSNPQIGDLLIPTSDIGTTYKAGKVYKYNGTTWVEIAYTDDTLAQEALDAARQGIEDAANGISLANKAQISADNAQTSANNAQTRAENAETNAKEYADAQDKTLSETLTENYKKYADTQDKSLSEALTEAYTKYTDSEISEFDKQVANYFGLGGGTIIGENYVISPIIEGGYLNITNTDNNSRVIIDPNNLTGNGYVFQVHNGSEVSVGIKSDGTTNINGHIYAKSLTLGDGVAISSSNISGLAPVAKSGSYFDLSGTPTIPTSVSDLGLDASTILYKGDITQTSKTDSNGNQYVETSVPLSDGTNITYSTYNAEDYIVFGRSKGTNSEGNNYVCVSTDGLLTARNALIYGTVYATDGEFSGKVTAKEGSITGNLNLGGSLTNTANGYTVTLRGVQSNAAHGIFYIYDTSKANTDNTAYPFRVNGDGSFSATKATLSGGTIGDWTIASTYIGASKDGVGSIYLASPSDNSDYWIRTHNAAGGGGTRTFSVSKTGKLYATGVDISGTITAEYGSIGGISIGTQGLSYSGASAGDGFALWRNGIHSHNNSYIIFHAGGNNSNIGGAPFRVYQNGNLVANNITSSSATITGGSFKVAGSSSSDTRVQVSYNNQYFASLASYGLYFTSNNGQGCDASLSRNGLVVKDTTIDANGNIIAGKVAIYPNGVSTTGGTCYIIVGYGNSTFAGCTISGWKTGLSLT